MVVQVAVTPFPGFPHGSDIHHPLLGCNRLSHPWPPHLHAHVKVFLDVGHVGRAWEVYIAQNPVRSGPLPSIAKLQVRCACVALLPAPTDWWWHDPLFGATFFLLLTFPSPFAFSCPMQSIAAGA